MTDVSVNEHTLEQGARDWLAVPRFGPDFDPGALRVGDTEHPSKEMTR